MTRLLAFMVAVIVGCSSNVQTVGERLARELPSLYPKQVTAVAFENAPPLDPPTLFVDLAPSMDASAQLAFLCNELQPRVQAVGGGIDVTVSYGWHSDDCRNSN